MSADPTPLDLTPLPAAAVRVLLVEDDDALRQLLARFLGTVGYTVESAANGEVALMALANRRYTVMLCDIRMPGMSGLEVLTRALAIDPDLCVLMLTAVNDAATAKHALVDGALDYLTKPFELSDLQLAILGALQKRRAAMERRRLDEWIREEVAHRTEELEREKTALRDLSVGIVETLVNAMEAKDVYLRGHSLRVGQCAAAIAMELGLSPHVIEQVRLAGRLQDIGRIGVREAVLNKRETLTEGEVEHIRDHVRIGVEILSPLHHLGDVLAFIADHHEHWDGGGYPRGLRGEEISIGGRILAAADTFDALTSRRPYRDPMAPQTAVSYMETLVGSAFDPRVFDALARVAHHQQRFSRSTPDGGIAA